jgi:hypothetical protein
MLFKINKDAILFLSGRRMKNIQENTLQRKVLGTDR